MDPLEMAKEYALKLRPGSTKRLILEFLIDQAPGRANAKSWDDIERHLSKFEKHSSQSGFQQSLLSDCRCKPSKFYIGSNDHSPHLGYFIILNDDDANVMANWYKSRIAKEESHLEYLESLFPGIATP